MDLRTRLLQIRLPLVFEHDARIWLIGRRYLTETGAYDLEMRDLEHATQSLTYQGVALDRACCRSLWEVDPHDLTVSHVLDLPSRGDTCFASILSLVATGSKYGTTPSCRRP